MQNQHSAATLLEQLPFAILAAEAGGSLYANAAARDIVQLVPERLTGLAESHPLLSDVLAGSAPPAEAISIGPCRCLLYSWSIRDGQRAVVLVPVSLLDRIAPSFSQLDQLCNDFQEIFRNSFDGIFIVDGDGRTLMVNEGCERNYDLKAEDMVGRHVSEFEKQGLIKPVIGARIIAERQRVTAVQHTHAGKTIMVTGIPLLDAEGRVRKVIINSRDTTELLELQEELARARDHVRRMESEAYELRLENLKLGGVVLDSAEMKRIAALSARVAKVDTTILITGESGVGKEVIARFVHRESHRVSGPFIKINCGAIPRELLESELFGYESGAFTGALRQGKVGLVETASGGTLFLDEVGELPLDLQVKILQVLQDRSFSRVGGTRSIEVDLRIIAATNVDLEAMVERRLFRSDLYYRLNVVRIAIPPLKSRREDVLPLIRQYLDEFNSRYGFEKRISESALGHLLEYNWPGNVRELRNIIERLVVTTADALIDADDLPSQILPAPDRSEEEGLDYRQRVARFESRLIERALKKYGTTRSVAARLNISQSTVVRKLNGQGPTR